MSHFVDYKGHEIKIFNLKGKKFRTLRDPFQWISGKRYWESSKGVGRREVNVENARRGALPS